MRISWTPTAKTEHTIARIIKNPYKITLKEYLLLLLFPTIFLVFQIFMKVNYRYFFISDFDPSYAFLFNGLNIARGIADSGLAGFPGATVQFYVGLVIHLGHFFHPGNLITEDVLLNPEYYLNIASIGIISIIALISFLSGYCVLKKTKRIYASLMLQFIPLISVFGFYYYTLIMCEPFLLIATQVILLQLTLYYFSAQKDLSDKQLIVLSVTIGFGFATKMTFVPMFFLPLLLIKGFLHKLKYFAIFIVSMGIFMLPVYNNIPEFLNWNKMIFLHTGLYGSGEKNIIDLNQYVENLKTIFTDNILFTLVVFGLVFYFLFRLKKDIRNNIPEKDHLLLKAFSMVIFLLVLVLSKHYRPYYSAYFYGLIILPSILLMRIIANHCFYKKLLQVRQRTVLIIVILAGFGLFVRLYTELHPRIYRRHLFTDSINMIHEIAGTSRKILLIHEGASAFQEGGLYYGSEYSHNQKSFYHEVLRRLYPDTYFYHTYAERLFGWDADTTLEEILLHDRITYIVTRLGNKALPAGLLKKLENLMTEGNIKEVLLVYENDLTRDYVHKLIYHTEKH